MVDIECYRTIELKSLDLLFATISVAYMIHTGFLYFVSIFFISVRNVSAKSKNHLELERFSHKNKYLSGSDPVNLIKASLMEIMTENKDYFKEIFSEIIEDAGMINAIQKGRKNKFVDEKNIMSILEG